MARTKLPPRLYFHEARGCWTIRYEGWMRQTPFKRDQRDEAEAMLAKIVGAQSWVHAIRSLRPAKRVAADPPWARSRASGLIYFVSSAEQESYPIKIGFCASDMDKRLCELQIGNPFALAVLATTPATYAQEQGLHKSLSASRLVGEWFRRSAEVENALADALAGNLYNCSVSVQTTEIT